VDRDRNVAGGGLGERLLEQVQCDPHVAGRIREEHLAEREQGRSKRALGVPVGGDAAVDPVVDERVGGEGGLLVEGVAVDGRG